LKPSVVRRTRHLDRLLARELDRLLSVQGEEELLAGRAEPELEARLVVDHERSDAQSVRADRREDEHPHGRMDDRSSGGERVRGRSRRGREDHAVCLEDRQERPVDAGLDVDRPAERAAAQDRVVQRLVDLDATVAPAHGRPDHAATIDRGRPLEGLEHRLG
jgi:hypothetical protein